MAQSGLETLYQHLGPATASMVAGNREYDSNHSQDLLDQFKSQEIAKQQADAEQAVKMNPMLLEQQQFKNTGMGLENIGQGIKNTTGTLANQVSQATQPGVIEGTNAENKGKVGKEQIEQMTRGSEMAGQFATQLEQVPVLARPQVIQEYMAKYNIDPNGPIGSMITKVSPADLPGVLKNMQTKLHQSSAAYQQAMDTAKEHSSSAKEVAGIHAGATIGAANIHAAAARAGIAARAQAKVVDPNVIASKLGFEKGAAYYMIQSETADTPEEKEQFLTLAKKFERANIDQKNARAGTTASLPALGIATNPVTSALDNGTKAGTPGKIIDLR